MIKFLVMFFYFIDDKESGVIEDEVVCVCVCVGYWGEGGEM